MIGLLSALGRHGTGATAISIGLGLVLPLLSELARPLLQVTIFALLVTAYLRVDPAAVARRLARPRLVLLSTVLLMIVLPLTAGAVLGFTGLARHEPQLTLILLIVTTAPPVMSSPAFAYLMNLDGPLSVALLIVCMIITPISAPLIAALLPGHEAVISAAALSLRLFGLLAGSLLAAVILRKLIGSERLQSAGREIDGFSVILLFIFALAAMDGVALRFLAEPALVATMTLACFTVALTQMLVAWLVLAGRHPVERFTVAMSAGNRNMAIMVAALGGAVPEFTWLYFALGQFPIYLLPYLMHPIARRLVTKHGAPGD